MSTIVEDLDAMVERLQEQDIAATADPRAAMNAEGVIVLVEPPTRNYLDVLQTWQLTVLRVTTDVGYDTTVALAAVVDQLEKSDFPIEEARPGARRLSPDRAPVPAYICRFTSP